MSRIMLDTNTVSHLLRGHPGVARRLRAVPMAALCISSVTKGELLFGLARRPEARRLHGAVRELLRRTDVLPWDGAVAEVYGALRADLEAQGRPLGAHDMLIAAQALHGQATLVTSDGAFSMVPALRCEDWTGPW